MRIFYVLVLLCFSHVTAIAASAALVIRDDGYYLLSSDSTELVKVSAVVDQRTSPGDPLPSPEQPDNEPTVRANQIADLTKGVGTREEATTLAAVATALSDQKVSGSVAWDTAFRLTLNRVSGSVSPAWEAWKGKVDALAGGFPTQFFTDVAAGIETAHSLNTVAVQAVAAGGENVDLELEPQAMKLPEIIALIKHILQLLQDLGVFKPGT